MLSTTCGYRSWRRAFERSLCVQNGNSLCHKLSSFASRSLSISPVESRKIPFVSMHSKERLLLYYGKSPIFFVVRRLSTKEKSSSEPMTLRKPLNEKQKLFLDREIGVLETLKSNVKEVNVSKEDFELLQNSIDELQGLFLLVIVGEFNSGKSTFLNALLGKEVLKEGVTPTTSKIGILKYASTFQVVPNGENCENITVPVEWLQEINLVDTPGTNAIIRDHQRITEHFVPRSDLILFVTSVDRPFSESERLFLERIKSWRKKVLIIISKIDILESPKELDTVVQFVCSSFEQFVGWRPMIFPVSARAALRAKLEVGDGKSLSNHPQWKKSRFAELEDYIFNVLNSEERTRLKFENPMGIANRLIEKCTKILLDQSELLKSDLNRLEEVDSILKAYRKEMNSDFERQKDKIDVILMTMKERGETFLASYVSLGNIWQLMRGEMLRKDFELKVVDNTSGDIDQQVSTLIDWMVSKNAKTWKEVIDALHRPQGSSVVAAAASFSSWSTTSTLNNQKLSPPFEYNRMNLLQSIGKGAQQVMRVYDREAESLRLSQEVRQALLQTAAIEVGALGLGGVFLGSLLDITGMLGIGALATFGLAVLPSKRASLQKAFAGKINDIRDKLKGALQRHFDSELDNSIHSLQEAIRPYERFVHSEREKFEDLQKKFLQAERQLSLLREDLQRLFPSGSSGRADDGSSKKTDHSTS